MISSDTSAGGSVIALDAQDGAEQWQTTFDASEPEGIVVADDRCIVAYGTKVVALGSRSGDRIWTQPIRGRFSSDPLVADETTGTVLVDTSAGIEAFGAANGEKLWETDMLHPLVHTPAVYDERVFAVGKVDDVPSLVALSLDDSSECWRSELTSAPESAAPVATQEGVFVSDGETLVVHDRETGDRLRELYTFSHDDGKYDIELVAVDNGTVFVTSDRGDAVALNSETGTERWRLDIPVDSAPGGICVGTETVLFPIYEPEYAPEKETISAFDRESGARRWHYGLESKPHSGLTSQPVLVDGAVFVTATHTDDGLGVLGDVPELES
ncbi:WD-40 repeat-containing protein [Halovivax asiaticus JCM 14624]|uniref:WD-40 repeat-containing protein n=2 Tax=Halovivax asiaticus TaxID=332953 RepID=M0BE31_9EURY|nr:WD-40 repeat-containing protein [Halovivax asiaticus JCM 14624]